MSFAKVLELSNKFTKKLLKYADHQKVDFDDFAQELKALLNEMRGDFLTLKYKGYDRSKLVIFNKIYEELLNILKTINDNQPKFGIRRFVMMFHEKDMKNLIKHTNEDIQKFLKENEIEFTSGPKMRQAYVDSLNKIIQLADKYQLAIGVKEPEPVELKSIKSEEEDVEPTASENDVTKVRK